MSRSLDLNNPVSMKAACRGQLRSRGGREGSWKAELQSNTAPQKDRIRKSKIRVSVLVLSGLNEEGRWV